MIFSRKKQRSQGQRRKFSIEIDQLIDTKFYLDSNPDIAQAGVDPSDHFLKTGWWEPRSPNAFVDLIWLAKRGVYNPERDSSPDEILHVLDELPATETALSAIFCPHWIALQLGLTAENHSVLDLLLRHNSESEVSLHPGLSVTILPDSSTPIFQKVLALPQIDLQRTSLVSLRELRRQHKDFQGNDYSDRELLQHLWTVGLSQNRLRYQGVTAREYSTAEERFRDAVGSVFRSTLQGIAAECGQSISSLPVVEVSKNPLPDAARAVVSFSNSSSEPPSWEELLWFWRFRSTQGNDETYLLPRRSAAPRKKAWATDRDLLNGNHSIRSKRVVFSAVLDSYDDAPIAPPLEDCSYILVTNTPEIADGTDWTVLTPTINERDNKRICLWYKTHPHLLFPHTQRAVWIDGNVRCNASASEIFTAHEMLSEVATFQHPDRNCSYEEAHAVLDLELESNTAIERTVGRLREAEFPEQQGLFETNVISAQINDLAVRSMFENWWREIFLGGRRDQLSFAFAAWKVGVAVTPLDGNRTCKDSQHFSKVDHRTMLGRYV